MSTRPIRFWHQGKIREVTGVSPTRSVLDWLREDQRLTGTKEGCNEGDCGACTVIVAELAERGDGVDSPASRKSVVGGLRLRTVNSCLQFLPTLDGKALLTVEDLATIGHPEPTAAEHALPHQAHAEVQPLHPAQQALVDCHGSQCGFCTPGFAMSLAASYEWHCERGTTPARSELADALAGNLCRCTGYRPILDAGERMFELPPRRLDTAPIVAALQTLQADAALVYEGPNAAAPAQTQRFHAPRSLDEFARLREALPQARLLAGATDIGLWVNKQFRDLGEVLYIGEVEALRHIETSSHGLRIGAAASLEDAWSALAARWPALTEMWLRFASPPVRHAGTLGGNIANGSPIGDGAPVLIALDAQIVLRLGARQREMPLEAFYVDYMKNELEPGEFVEALDVPAPAPDLQLRAWKISKRYDSDISSVSCGLAIALDGNTVRHARFAFGGMAATVRRAQQAEAAVLGQPWTEATLDAAIAALARDFAPLTDLRASADYRRRVAGNLLRRLWLETRPADPLPATATRAWIAIQPSAA